MIENNEIGIFNFVNKNKINIYDLYLWAREKFCTEKNYIKLMGNKIKTDTKIKMETTRESIELVPDKLEKYDIEDVYKSLHLL